MTKPANTSYAYNVLFQEHRDEIGSDGQRDDLGQSCHIFAIASPMEYVERNKLNQKFSHIGHREVMQAILTETQYEGDELIAMRSKMMGDILKLREEQETVLEVDDMYLCGGFSGNEIMPEHMWIEDRSHQRTYDTFINRGGIAVRYCTGEVGQNFQSGSETHPFSAENIYRVKIPGYTKGQLVALVAGAENHDAVNDTHALEEAIAKKMQEDLAVMAAREVVNQVEKKVKADPDKDEYPEKKRAEMADFASNCYRDTYFCLQQPGIPKDGSELSEAEVWDDTVPHDDIEVAKELPVTPYGFFEQPTFKKLSIVYATAPEALQTQLNKIFMDNSLTIQEGNLRPVLHDSQMLLLKYHPDKNNGEIQKGYHELRQIIQILRSPKNDQIQEEILAVLDKAGLNPDDDGSKIAP